MNKLRPLVHPIKDPEGRRAWAAKHRFCWACGVLEEKAKIVRIGGLQTHHIVKPCRSDEPCNYARLCSLCHDLAEGKSIAKRHGTGCYKKIPPKRVLELKQKHDPANWDPARLMALWGRDCLPGEEDE